MTAALVQRQVGLAGVALLAGLMALALGRPDGGGELQPVGAWYEATVSTYGPGSYGRTTACGTALTPETRGVAHPVLPCDAKLFVAYAGREVATEVVDRGPHGPGRQFDLTAALAGELGVVGVQVVRWRFAGER